MNDQSSRIRALLRKFLRNECNEDEMRDLLAYLNSQEGVRAAGLEMDESAAASAGITVSPEMSRRLLDRLKSSIDIPGEPSEAGRTVSVRKRSVWRFAASVAGLLMLACLGYLILNREPPARRYLTEAGQKRTVILSDGSLVTLNSGSSVSFRVKDSRREVLLDGEAYFDVKHDPEKPFFVNTSQIEIKVLGTAFNVRSYAGDGAVETTLVRGKVTVRNLGRPENREEIELLPNQQAVFDKATRQLNKADSKTETAIAWHRGNLVFEDEPVQHILAELGKWYNVSITADPDSKDCRFNIFIENETLPEVLELFEGIHHVRVVREGNEIRIKGKLCK